MRYFKKISKFLPLSFKVRLISILRKKEMTLSNDKRAIVFLSADYGNIGDIAISAAQREYLKSILTDHNVVCIPISQTRLVIQSIKKQIRTDDLITIIGGGNMGAMYPDIEELRQLVIRSFPQNRIVCFPQTLDWDNSAKSKRALHHIVKTYSQHPDIHVFARESITYAKLDNIFNEHANVNVSLVPDIVMSATAEVLGAKDTLEPSGILRCLRDDKEAALSVEQYTMLDNALANTGYAIEKTDTHAGGSQLGELYCSKLLADKLSQFRSAKLVVTDRLHGMILSLLSGTPCLVLPNANHKIRQTQLDWLQNHPRLIFVEPEQFGEIPNFINQLLSETRGTLSESPVDINQYNSLKEALNSI